MIKAVNMNGYKFGKLSNIQCKGFGMLDTETDMFVSFSGILPCVYGTKKLVQEFIDAGFPDQVKKRVAHN